MRAVPAVDATAMNQIDALYEKCKAGGVTLVLSHVNPQPLATMKKSGFYDKIGEENFCKDINTALDRAKSIK